MPSPQFYTDYRHLLQINKQNHTMQLMFIFFMDCICREKNHYQKNQKTPEDLNYFFFLSVVTKLFNNMF